MAVQIAENGNATYTLRWQMPGGSEVVGSWNTTGPSAGIYIPLIPSINNGKDDEKKVKKPIVKDLDVNIDNLIKILGSKIYPKPELSQNITQPRVSLEGKEATVTGEDSIVIYGPRVFKVMEDAYLKEGAAIFADNRVPQAQVLEDKRCLPAIRGFEFKPVRKHRKFKFIRCRCQIRRRDQICLGKWHEDSSR